MTFNQWALTSKKIPNSSRAQSGRGDLMTCYPPFEKNFSKYNFLYKTKIILFSGADLAISTPASAEGKFRKKFKLKNFITCKKWAKIAFLMLKRALANSTLFKRALAFALANSTVFKRALAFALTNSTHYMFLKFYSAEGKF